MGLDNDMPLFESFDPDESCPCCGRRMYNKHSLSPCLVGGLFQLAIHAGSDPVNIKDCRFDRTTWDNFQKLRYWGLVRHHGHKKSGVWSVTSLGMRFLRGLELMPKWAYTKEGGVVVGTAGEMVTARTVSRSEPWVYRYDDYIRRLAG